MRYRLFATVALVLAASAAANCQSLYVSGLAPRARPGNLPNTLSGVLHQVQSTAPTGDIEVTKTNLIGANGQAQSYVQSFQLETVMTTGSESRISNTSSRMPGSRGKSGQLALTLAAAGSGLLILRTKGRIKRRR